MTKVTLSPFFLVVFLAPAVAFLTPVVTYTPATSPRIAYHQKKSLLVSSALASRSLHFDPRLYQKGLSKSSPLFASRAASLSDDEADDIKIEPENKNILGKFVGMLKPQKSEKLSTKELLKKMGLSALLSYGFVSNITSVIITSLSWFTFSKKSGMSPLAPGQWKGFLTIYAGFYVFSNLIRPLRIGLAVGISKYFDMALNQIQEKINCPRAVAIGILVFFANILVTCGVMALGVSLASLLSGVPIFPPKA